MAKARQQLDKLSSLAFRGWNRLGLLVPVDSGGHFTDDVYKYCGARLRVFLSKAKGRWTPLVHHIRNNKYRLQLIMLGVDSVKQQ